MSTSTKPEATIVNPPATDRFKWSVVSAVNNDQVLKSCLLSSPDVSLATEVLLQRGYASAALAYNEALDRASTDVVVFAHQDVYLPEGWLAKLQQALEWLSDHDPNWAVAGVWGVNRAGGRAGNVYCTGLGCALGKSGELPVAVRTLDELLLIVRKSSGVRFDGRLQGYHFYGTDLCLEAERQQKTCYALSVFCVHNTNGYGMLPWQFWKTYLWMRRKWKSRLPILTPCTEITAGGLPMLKWNLIQGINILLGRHHPGKRVADPVQLHRELLSASR